MRVIKADVFMGIAAFCLLMFAGMLVHSSFGFEGRRAALKDKAVIVEYLGLTDLCLFTEARYTRHPSVADLSTAFQDHPMSLEHFPSGALLLPPPHLRGEGQ